MIANYAANLVIALLLCTLVGVIRPYVDHRPPGMGPPGVTVLTDSPSGKTVLTRDDYRPLAEAIRLRIDRGQPPDEIPYRGLVYSFSGSLREETRTVDTGVEFLGEREKATQTAWRLERLGCLGVYTPDGDLVGTLPETDARRIQTLVNNQ